MAHGFEGESNSHDLLTMVIEIPNFLSGSVYRGAAPFLQSIHSDFRQIGQRVISVFNMCSGF